MNTQQHLQNNQMLFWKEICAYFIHKKNKTHSINELLETFGFAEEYKHETTKQKIINSSSEFPMKIYDSMSRNSI